MTIIYLDVDGVLAQFAEAVVDKYNEVNGTGFTANDVTGWNFQPIIQEPDKWYNYARDLEMWKNLLPYPWAEPLVKAVIDTGYPWAFLTSLPIKPKGVLQARRDWVDREFGHLEQNISRRIVVAKRKELVVHEGDFLIDDTLDNCKAVRKAGGRTLLLMQPWNRDAEGKLTRCSVEHVFQVLEGLKRCRSKR